MKKSTVWLSRKIFCIECNFFKWNGIFFFFKYWDYRNRKWSFTDFRELFEHLDFPNLEFAIILLLRKALRVVLRNGISNKKPHHVQYLVYIYIGVEKNMLASSKRDISVLSTLYKYMIDNKVFNTSIFPKYYRTFAMMHILLI